MLLCTFSESLKLPSAQVGTEAKNLIGKTGFIITARAEEQFYISNNLPENLRETFKPINPRRLDEDLLEVLCSRASQRILEAIMLEDFIAQIYTAFDNSHFSSRLSLRRPTEKHLETANSKREVLLALKRLWAKDWQFDAVLKRLDSTGKIGLDARAVYLLQN
jgi:phosphoenolpyruvate synthase/pyruvate phosphate dikinase